jgi:hypothetical protein
MKSIRRTKFIKLLSERLKEVSEQEKALLKEHCNLDEHGEPKKKEKGTKWDVKDEDAFVADKKELYQEEIVIEGADSHAMLKTVKEVLTESDKSWSGQEAITYAYLYDKFENIKEDEK